MATPTVIATVGGTNSNSFGTRAEADAYFDSVLHADAAWPANVSATAVLGSGVNGVVNISVSTPGTEGNAYSVVVSLGSGNNVAMSASFATPILTVTLGTDGSGVADPTKNTAILVAAAIDALAEFSATYTGTGSSRIPVTASTAFSGGSYVEEIKNPALIMAAQQLNALVDWVGFVTATTQRLLWPRTGMLQRNELAFVPSDTIPEEIKHAQFELARLLIQEDRTADSDIDSTGLTHLRAGPITLKFRDYGSLSTSVLTSAVWNLLVPSWYRGIDGMDTGTRELERS